MSHSWQLNGFSPLWILGSSTKYLCTQNFLSQTWQANGFSPVWIQWCTFNFHVTLVTVEWLFANVNSRKPKSNTNQILKTSCHKHDRQTAFHQCEFNDAQSIFMSHLWQLNRLFAIWNSRKLNQIPMYLELLVTNMTGKRLLTSVNSMMHIQFSCQTRDSLNGFSPMWILGGPIKYLCS